MIPKELSTRQPAFTVIAASEAISMPLGSNAVYLALYPGSASRTRKEKWAWGRGYCLLTLWVQVWSFDLVQFCRYCMIWLLSLCMRTWRIILVYQILLDSFALYSSCVWASYSTWPLMLTLHMCTCIRNGHVKQCINWQSSSVYRFPPPISPQTLPRHTKKAEAGFRSLRPLAPPHPSPYRKGSGNETNWDILQLHIFIIHVGIDMSHYYNRPFSIRHGVKTRLHCNEVSLSMSKRWLRAESRYIRTCVLSPQYQKMLERLCVLRSHHNSSLAGGCIGSHAGRWADNVACLLLVLDCCQSKPVSLRFVRTRASMSTRRNTCGIVFTSPKSS